MAHKIQDAAMLIPKHNISVQDLLRFISASQLEKLRNFDTSLLTNATKSGGDDGNESDQNYDSEGDFKDAEGEEPEDNAKSAFEGME